MELWIRSQSKEELLKIYNVSINKDNYIIGNLISDDNRSVCDYWILGMYKSKERALEVLDEIEKILKPNIMIKSYDNVSCYKDYGNGFVQINPTETTVEQFSTYVYQMPIE